MGRKQAGRAENGVYLWNGAAVAMTRAPGFDTAAELAGSVIQVVGGTDAGRSFRQSSLSSTGTLNTDAVDWLAIDGDANYVIEVWILKDSVTDANRIAAMQSTSRPMSLLDASFPAHVRSTAVIGYPFRNARIGFTTGQATTTTDQNITVTDAFTTWLQ